MKKIMVALAAVAFAAGVQAASVTWNWTSTCYNGWNDGQSAQAGTMYIFNANSTTQQAVLTAILEGADISTLSSMDKFTTADGKMGSTSKKTLTTDHTTFEPARTEGAISYADFFYAMVIADGDTTNIYLSDVGSKQIQTAKETTLAASVSSSSKVLVGESATYTTAGWYTQSIPEPTSGLLLLLGMAGLALKRKHA